MPTYFTESNSFAKLRMSKTLAHVSSSETALKNNAAVYAYPDETLLLSECISTVSVA